MPFSGGNMTLGFSIDGKPTLKGEGPSARLSLVDAQYVKTMGIPMMRGRWFNDSENRLDSTAAVVTINEAFAQKFFPGEDPLGKRLVNDINSTLAQDNAPHPHRMIIGVVANTRRLNRSESIQPEYFLPYFQAPIGPFTVAVRTAGDPHAMVETARRLVNELSPGTPLYRVRTMDEGIRRTNRDQRFQAALMSGFSVVSLLLAAVGIYGLLSYIVAQRTAEFGVRLALGAMPGDVLKLVLRRGLHLTLIGLVIGAAAAYALSARIQSLLYETAPSDPLIYGGTALLLLAVAIVASWLPARRAARLEPVEVLRQQ
jgi:predicted permease